MRGEGVMAGALWSGNGRRGDPEQKHFSAERTSSERAPADDRTKQEAHSHQLEISKTQLEPKRPAGSQGLRNFKGRMGGKRVRTAFNKG